jgi:hypothetical protein
MGATAGGAVSDANARACDILLLEGKSRVDKIVFGADVKGTFIREAPRVAVSMVVTKDTGFPADALKVQVVGAAASDLQVKQVKCVNSKAEALQGVTVTLK